jgi:thioredoxin 1
MGNLVTQLNESTFSDTVEKDGSPILIDFWAEWCMPCRALAPVIDELATEFEGKVRFGKVNVDESRAIAQQFGIRGIPTLILFQNGKKVNELVGNQPKEKIKSLLTSV